MNDPRAPLVQIHVLLVAVVPVYNIPGGGELRFSGKILAQIYLGAIKNWNDPAISRLNPDVALPDLPIEVFHRDEGTGNFVKAVPTSMTAACVATEGSVRQAVRSSFVDARYEASYSITCITWVYLPA